jgi:hypothetical protein
VPKAPPPPTEVLIADAEEAEAGFRYRAAYELYLRAARAYDADGLAAAGDDARFRGALCLQKHETWRASAAAWEYVGDRVGATLSPISEPHPRARGQDEMFHVISHESWRELYPWYYRDPQGPEAARHRQAFAYMWGAREEVGRHLEHGVRLYRKAALAWECSSWGTLTPQGTRPAGVDDPTGEKWRLAANCWFLACYHAAASIDPEDREWEWVLEKKLPPLAPGAPRPDSLPLGRASDVDRLLRCWREYGLAKRNTQLATELACQQLRMLQDGFARSGRKDYAKEIFQLREQELLKPSGGPLLRRARRLARSVWFFATRTNTDLPRISLIALLLYVVVFPAIYKLGGLIAHSDAPNAPISVADSIVFSVATLVTLSVRDLVIESPGGGWVQTLEAISAYFVLGYVIWVVLRTFEE